MADLHPMTVGLGKDTDGRAVLANIASMPHLLIAGASGSGKSACVHALVTSILTRATPDTVRMILADTRGLELTAYRGVPHLLTQVITDSRKAAAALQWIIGEIDRRYDDLAACGFRHIDHFNKAIRTGNLAAPGGQRVCVPYPYLLVIADDFGDLMVTSANEAETAAAQIVRLGRPAGVHLVAVTQHPAAELLRARLPSRLAFTCASMAASQVILDRAGAEKLRGQGDCLFLPAGASRPIRLQGAYVTEKETRQIIAHCTKPPEPGGRTDTAAPDRRQREIDAEIGADLELLIQAAELIISTQFGSRSMLQRKLRVSFAKVSRLMDLLESYGVVGPSENSKAREVLVRPDGRDAVIVSLRRLR